MIQLLIFRLFHLLNHSIVFFNSQFFCLRLRTWKQIVLFLTYLLFADILLMNNLVLIFHVLSIFNLKSLSSFLIQYNLRLLGYLLACRFLLRFNFLQSLKKSIQMCLISGLYWKLLIIQNLLMMIFLIFQLNLFSLFLITLDQWRVMVANTSFCSNTRISRYSFRNRFSES